MPLNHEEKVYILTHVWERPAAEADTEAKKFHFYFKRYDEIIRWRPSSVCRQLNHKNIAVIARKLLTDSKECCAKLLESLLQSGHLGQDTLDTGLRYVINLLFCLGPSVIGPEWKPDELLRDYLASVFLHSEIDENFRMPRSFNLCTIDEITDINITWTEELNRHLELSDDDGDVRVFHCVSILDLFRVSLAAQRLFPAGLIEETTTSLRLICPGEDMKVRNWLEKEQAKYKYEPGFDASLRALHARGRLGIAGRRIEGFDFWRNRLIMVKEVFDLREPRNILHFWRDYRRPSQWWTFWIALTAFVLSLVACIEGAMQVYKAYHPTR